MFINKFEKAKLVSEYLLPDELGSSYAGVQMN